MIDSNQFYHGLKTLRRPLRRESVFMCTGGFDEQELINILSSVAYPQHHTTDLISRKRERF